MLRRSASSRTRAGCPYARGVFLETGVKIKQGKSSLVPRGVMVEEGQRGAPASEGMMIVFGANAQVALRNQADQSAHVIGGNLVTA